MNTKEITKHIQQISPVNEEDMLLFFELAKYQKVKKNTVLLAQGEQISPFLFIKKGCLMTYHQDAAGFRHVIQFGIEMWWTGDMQSMLEETASFYGIKAMEDTELYCFDRQHFEALTSKAPAFEHYFRILFQKSLIHHQKRIIRNISFSAEERYEAFVRTFPKLEQIIPQKYIASYLGITPEFLSKMKARLYRKNIELD